MLCHEAPEGFAHSFVRRQILGNWAFVILSPVSSEVVIAIIGF